MVKKSNNSSSTFLLMKIIETQYKESFEKGEIHFSTPESWINYQNTGRGDRFEGTYANPMKYSRKKITKKLALFDDSYIEEGLDEESRIYLKRKSSVKKYCCCFYNLNEELFKEKNIKENNNEKVFENDVEAYIPKKYFEDFLDDMNSQYTVFLLDPEKFYNQLIGSIKRLKVKKENILSQDIEYVDLKRRFQIEKNENELFFKDIRFKHQNELRIIINSTDKVILTMFESMKGNIKIERFNECILGQIDLNQIPQEGWCVKGIGEFHKL